MTTLLPLEVAARLEEFLRAGKTGRLVIDINRGRVVGARLEDAIPVNQGGRVERGG